MRAIFVVQIYAHIHEVIKIMESFQGELAVQSTTLSLHVMSSKGLVCNSQILF